MPQCLATAGGPPIPVARHWGSDVAGATVLNFAQAGGPFFALLILARTHGLSAAGEFAYAQAITAPLAQLFNLQLKALILTHSAVELPIPLAASIRLLTTGLGFLSAVALALWFTPSAGLWMFVRLADSWAEIYQAEAQRLGRMWRAASSASARAVALLVSIALTASLIEAALFYLTISLILFVLLDRLPGPALAPFAAHTLRPILHRGSVLGLVLFLQALSANFPRLSLERHSGLESLGLFATLAVLLQAGNLAASAFGQGLLPSLPQASLRRILFWVSLPGLAATAASALEFAAAPVLLRLLHVADTPAHRDLLLAVGLSQIFIWPSAVIGNCLTSKRLYGELLWVGAALVASSALASYTLVPAFGAIGAVAALAVPSLVNLLVSFAILLRRGRP